MSPYRINLEMNKQENKKKVLKSQKQLEQQFLKNGRNAIENKNKEGKNWNQKIRKTSVAYKMSNDSEAKKENQGSDDWFCLICQENKIADMIPCSDCQE